MGFLDKALNWGSKLNNFAKSGTGKALGSATEDVLLNDREKSSETQLLFGTQLSHNQKELERIQVQKEVLRSDIESCIDEKDGTVPASATKYIQLKAGKYGWKMTTDKDYDGHQVFHFISTKYEEWMWNMGLERKDFKAFEIFKVTVIRSQWNNSMWIGWMTDMNQFV